MDYSKAALEISEKFQGKIDVVSKVSVNSKEDLSIAYTPGVAEPCRQIAKNPDCAYKYTIKGRTIAVVTDGSAVLGLGNIGPTAGLPVMEGKSLLFKEFAGVDAFPICLDTQDVDEIVKTVKYLAPGFGGINLEDIAAPRCFEIEKKLQNEVDIPVFHDDQHGTAIVVAAAVMNSFRLKKKDLKDVVAVINGAGAAGTAIYQMLESIGIGEIRICDKEGLLKSVNPNTYPDKRISLQDSLVGADLFVGVSAPNLLKSCDIAKMNEKPVVFAMANPTPEIMPDEAKKGGAYIVGTGRSDFPNQINNVLVFPGFFKGLLQSRAKRVTKEMKLAAVQALANYIPESELNTENIIPDPLDKGVAKSVSEAVASQA